jgi:hypothetical protein
MARWTQLDELAAEIAGPGRELLDRHGIAYLGTVRADGSPRVHPVAPVLTGGDLFVAIADRSPKWRDLRHAPRCVLHALPGARDDEFVLRCRAVEDTEDVDAVREAAGHVIHDDDHVFRFEIERADHGWWEMVGQPGTFQRRLRWTPEAGVERARPHADTT